MAATYSLRNGQNQPYRYSPLDTSKPTIRLLEVLSVLTEGQLSLAIKHIPMTEAKRQYHTISYTWGNDEPSHRVYVESQYLLLRDSIWSFLKHHYQVRSLTAPRWLWIDSICINQSDIPEKNQQVSMMGQIFRGSYGTLIGLDTMSIQGSFSMSFQSYWSKIPRNATREERDQQLDIFLYGSTDSKIHEHRKTLRQDAIDLLKHDYWRRLWVVQEIILSRKISIITGRTTVSLDLIFRSLYDSVPYGYDGTISRLLGDGYLDYSLQRLHTNRMSGSGKKQSLGLLQLVHEFGRHYCQDIRDRIYGLRALTAMSDRVVVDYNCHIVSLFAETFKSYVLGSRDFGPRRENTNMHNIKSLMRALNVRHDIVLEHIRNQELPIWQTLTDQCYKIMMVPTVLYTITFSQQDNEALRFHKLIEEYDRKTHARTNLSIHVDMNSNEFHDQVLCELYNNYHNLDSSNSKSKLESRYLLCNLPRSRFQTIIRVAIHHSIKNKRNIKIELIGTVASNSSHPNSKGNLITPLVCHNPKDSSIPSHIFKDMNNRLQTNINSRKDFYRAAFKQKVKWPGYILNCSIYELVCFQWSHDTLYPEEE